MPINRRAKCDAASFILGGEICNPTNKQRKQNYKQTVTDISTPCLSACVACGLFVADTGSNHNNNYIFMPHN